MRKFYNILCVVLILALLCPGVISLVDKDPVFSEVQNRELKSFPEFDFLALLSGAYLEDLMDYYADTFPGREELVKSFEGLEGFYTFGGSPEETE